MWSLLLVGVVALAPLAADSAQEGRGPFIRLQYATFDPLERQPQVEQSLRMPPMAAGDTSRFLLQFQGPVRVQWLNAVRSLGVVLESYVPDYTYIARMTLAQAAALPTRFPFVRWVGPFHPAYKIDPVVLRQKATVPLVAETFTRTEGVVLGQRLKQYGAGVLEVSGDRIAVIGSPQLAAQLARTAEVRWVQMVRPKRLMNDRAATIMRAAGSGSPRLRGLYGEGQVIGLADSGLDTGNLDSINEDFRGRVIRGIPLGRRPGDVWDDPHGHGTHCAGSILGSGINSGSDPTRHRYDNSFAGVAPEARLVVQSLLDRYWGLSGVPSNLYDLFTEPYELGARVHSNSWGSGYAPEETRRGWYGRESAELDRFVYENPDMVLLFAAGNEGDDANSDGVIDQVPPSITPEASAKNILSIGASEGYRPPSENWGGASKSTWGAFFPWAPFDTDYISDNPNGMAAFSSRGPAADGRIKPDLVAPGTNIISVWSRPAAQLGNSGWGEFAGPYRDGSSRSKYCYMGGTSMATPLAAGACALVREYFLKGRPSWNPSAALVKAVLINGAYDLSPGQYGTEATREVFNRPNGVEGWGRIDLARSLYPEKPRTLFWIDRPQGLMTDQHHRLRYRVTDSSEPLIVNIVWTDPPATPVAYRALVNDLNLRVVTPDGTVIYGNRAPGATVPDQVNNVEMVQIDQPAVGVYEFYIEGANVVFPVENPRQTYALAVSGGGAPVGGRFPDIVPPQVSFVSPGDGAALRGTARIEVSAMDDQMIDRVTVKVDGKINLGSRFGAPYVFYWNTAMWSRGAHTITAEATDFGNNTTTASITVVLP